MAPPWNHRPSRFSTFFRVLPTFLTVFLTAAADLPVSPAISAVENFGLPQPIKPKVSLACRTDRQVKLPPRSFQLF